MAAVSSIVYGVVAATGAYSGIKQAEAAEKSQKQQKEMMEEQQATEKAAIAEQKATALEKRKTLIDKKRKQIYGAGDQATSYSIGQTGATGIEPAQTDVGTTLTGQELG